MSAVAPAKASRIPLIDALRGVAIIGVVFYHLAWDLSYFRLIGVDVSSQPAWVAFARSLLGAFVFLSGVSLVLAHGEAIRWPAFWRRFAVLLAAALIITVVTYLVFRDAFIYFGILHALALFSLMSLPFLKAPLGLTALLAIVFFVPSFLVQSTAFDTKPLSWIGFWTTEPWTNDLVPIFPWFGVALAGVFAGRLIRKPPLRERLAAIDLSGFLGRSLVWAGRWSLVIYLVHQLALMAVVYPVAMWLRPAEVVQAQGDVVQAQDFLRACEANCIATPNTEKYCTAYCTCGLLAWDAANLWDAVGRQATPAEQNVIDALKRQCEVEAR